MVGVLDELTENTISKIAETKDNSIAAAADLGKSIIDYTIKSAYSIAIDTARHSIHRFMNPGIP